MLYVRCEKCGEIVSCFDDGELTECSHCPEAEYCQARFDDVESDVVDVIDILCPQCAQ